MLSGIDFVVENLGVNCRRRSRLGDGRRAAVLVMMIMTFCCAYRAAAQTQDWAWMGGSSTANQSGIYGALDQPFASNIPGGRYESVTWTDISGNLWIFGGEGIDAAGINGNLGDLWKFNIATGQWTWVSGSTLTDHTVGAFAGVYGTKGVAAAGNNPGTRDAAIGWTDANGNLWLFGGYGIDTNGNSGLYDDLWKFNPATGLWAWMSGSNTIGSQGGLSGIYGAPTGTNFPGSRIWAQTWTDPSGNLWLFGGYGADGVGNGGLLNDFWRFSPSSGQWTWVSGSKVANQSGVYGTLGIPAVSNVPGGRCEAAYSSDQNGNFWLYGGEGYDGAGISGNLGDLWKFDIVTMQWTWVSGSSVTDHTVGAFAGVYGTKGVGNAGNNPGTRDAAVGWIDGSGNLWLSGGYGIDSTGTGGFYNDLWEFNSTTSQWTWVSGSNIIGSFAGQAGVYGTVGVPSSSSLPGSRIWASRWTDQNGNLWLFGGYGFDGAGNGGGGFLNDLWMY